MMKKMKSVPRRAPGKMGKYWKKTGVERLGQKAQAKCPVNVWIRGERKDIENWNHF